MGRLAKKDLPSPRSQPPDDTPPKELVREIMDTLREFGGDCTQDCGH